MKIRDADNAFHNARCMPKTKKKKKKECYPGPFTNSNMLPSLLSSLSSAT